MATNEKRFSFISLGLPGDTFGVVRFNGTEGLSKIYEFEIQLVSSDPELDLNEVIQNPARLTLLRDEGNVSFNGILSEFDQLHQVGEMCFYRALLVPKVWWLTQTPYNQVFLDTSIPEIIEQVLRSGGLMDDDFEIKLENDYPQWEYVCQYREPHMMFLQHLMEREGIYYYFEQTPSGEKMIITDTLIAHTAAVEGKPLFYSPPSGLDDQYREEVVKNFFCRQKIVPRSVHLKDHNFGRPDMNVEGSAEVFEEGHGEVYFFGDHFATPEEGDRLARIRAEEYRCWKQGFYGDSTIPFLRPGYTFTLGNHYRDSFNQDYLTVALTHEGSQASFMLAGLSGELSDQEKRPTYWNKITALPASVQFRPQRKTEKPHFYGTLHARIDAAGDGKYAELDEDGRYKVILPFDRSGRDGGKASAPIRMMQPSAGESQGMHFPLRKGTEVLLTFIDGDPDRPVIAGALPSPGSNPVNAGNQTMANITSGGGNKIHMEDKEGSQRILMHCDTPGQQSYIRIGAHNDPEDAWEGTKKWTEGAWEDTKEWTKDATDWTKEKNDQASSPDGLKLFSIGDMEIRVHNRSETIMGNSSSTVWGMRDNTTIGLHTKKVIGSDTNIVVGSRTHVFTGGLSEYSSYKSALIPGYALLFGKKVNTGVSEDKLLGQVTDLYTHHMKLLGSVEKLQGQVTELEGSKSEMTGTVNELKGQVSTLEGANSTLTGKVSTLSGSVTEMEGQSSKLAGSVSNLEGKVTNLTGNVTNLEGNMVRLSTSCAQLSGVTTMM